MKSGSTNTTHASVKNNG